MMGHKLWSVNIMIITNIFVHFSILMFFAQLILDYLRIKASLMTMIVLYTVFLVLIQGCSAFRASFGHKLLLRNQRSSGLQCAVPKKSIVEDELKKQVYCNVELNGSYIEAVGFDLDFTLAQYNDKLGKLIFESAKGTLAQRYSDSVLDFETRPDQFFRGLVIDQQRGNVLKIDRHKYVRTVMHGSQILAAEERKAIYNKEVASYSESNFVNIDNAHLLVAAQLFSCMVDMLDQSTGTSLRSYETVYRDVKAAVERSMEEGGVVSTAVMKDPGAYIVPDAGTVRTLQRLRSAGKKTFLLTNSMYGHTDKIMSHIVQNSPESVADWRDLFDVVVVGAHKPDYLVNDYLSMFQLDSRGTLHNIEYKEGLEALPRDQDNSAKVFQGGNWRDLHRLLGVQYGDKILYVADHMFNDILRSKRTLGWRTCLIIPELERETITAYRERELFAHQEQLRDQQDIHDRHIDAIVQGLKSGEKTEEDLNTALNQAEQLKQDLRQAGAVYDDRFNVPWGQMFKAGIHDSRFAKQVRSYACLYTSRMSNLQYVSPNRTFRPIEDVLPHEPRT